MKRGQAFRSVCVTEREREAEEERGHVEERDRKREVDCLDETNLDV